MAFTQTQLDALDAAIADGALTVKYADKTVTYRSLSEMKEIRGMMREELGLTGAAGSGVILPSYSKGFEIP